MDCLARAPKVQFEELNMHIKSNDSYTITHWKECSNLTAQTYAGTWTMRVGNVVSIPGSAPFYGFLTSPGYPSGSPNDVVAVAVLSSARNVTEMIRLSFDELHMQTANNCQGEALNIFLNDHNDDTLDTDKLIFTACGSRRLEPFIVQARSLAIQYVIDEFTSIAGGSKFRIKFEFIEHTAEPRNGCLGLDEFKCANRRCISKQLLCNRFDDCGDGSDEDVWTPCMELPSIPYRINYKCGLSSFGDSLITDDGLRGEQASLLENRIVGGRPVAATTIDKRRLPQASIQYMWIEPISHSCGGTLIHPMFVLTSAHCFKDELAARNYKVLFGLQNLEQNPQTESYIQVRYISHISFYPTFMHILPKSFFNGHDRANNIALIELNAPVRLTSHVWPACLPHLAETISAGRECITTGFGETRGSGSALALKQAKQIIQLGSECKSMFSRFSNDDYTMICVADESAGGPCQGDSGGPLLCRDDVSSDTHDVPIKSMHVDISEPERIDPKDVPDIHGEPGELIRYLEFSTDNDDSKSSPGRDDQVESVQTRYTVHGVTSFTTAGNIGGGYCGVKGVPLIYNRVSTRIEWILSVMRLALHRLNIDDNQQDLNNRMKMFGYMFRTGYSQHQNFTNLLTTAHNINTG